MAVSPFADSVAVATTGGVYQVDLMDSACQVAAIAAGAPKTPITALTWVRPAARLPSGRASAAAEWGAGL